VTTIDLSTPTPPPESLLDALPRRVALSLPELQAVAQRAGDAPLPFDVAAPRAASGAGSLESRLGTSRGTVEDQAYAAALAALHDPVESLTRRGLLDADGVLDHGVAGAVGLLATPRVALDLDVAVDGGAGSGGPQQVKAWHRQSGDAVATLATCDGLVFELAWFPTSAWPAELARVAVLPEDLVLRDSRVPDYLDLPFELADAAVEAGTIGRSDLVQVLTGRHVGEVRDGDGRPLPEAEVPGALSALATECHGRLRAMVADVSHATTTVVGVRSWLLLADGWRSLHSHQRDGLPCVEVRAADAGDLAADLAPVLAEVTS
jgi:hypothetical protein